MKNSNTVRIGCAAAFWGDTNTAAAQLAQSNEVDYIVFDYLAEVTMSILAGAKLKNPDMGYATDFVQIVVARLAPLIKKKGIKLIANAGGINPQACRAALEAVLKTANVDLSVAVVEGDNMQPKLAESAELFSSFQGNQATPPQQSLSSNAYLGAFPIAKALDEGADIVITGRIADSAMVLGPLIHEYQWTEKDYDQLSQGSLAGHIIECGAQCTGGNFTDWEQVQGFENMGFPIVHCEANGDFTVSKPDNTGGLINRGTVGEQLLYEIGDPGNYILPDVVCDWRFVSLTETDKNKVHVSGARGLPPTPYYKVSSTFIDGFKISTSFMLGGPKATEKAQRVSSAILTKVSGLYKLLGFDDFTATDVEILGSETTYGANANNLNSREVVVKIAAVHKDKKALQLFATEIAQAATAMAPGLTGLVGGRPKVSPRICLHSSLIHKSAITAEVSTNEQQWKIAAQTIDETTSNIEQAAIAPATTTEAMINVPLIQLAWARSGDKGNDSNIGVMAREASYLPWIWKALTEDNIAQYMSHVLDAPNSSVQRWALPGLNAMNFLLKNSLGGGGIASLRIDPQGKAFAQQLLDLEIPIPENLISADAS